VIHLWEPVLEALARSAGVAVYQVSLVRHLFCSTFSMVNRDDGLPNSNVVWLRSGTPAQTMRRE
jgi:hypothetical protein